VYHWLQHLFVLVAGGLVLEAVRETIAAALRAVRYLRSKR